MSKQPKSSQQQTPLAEGDLLIRTVLDSIETLDSPNDNLRSRSKQLLKSLHDYACSIQPSKFAPKGAIHELHIDGFSDGQIWEQMRPGIEHLSTIATKKQHEWLLKSKALLTPPQILPELSENELDSDGFSDIIDEDEDDNEQDEDDSDIDPITKNQTPYTTNHSRQSALAAPSHYKPTINIRSQRKPPTKNQTKRTNSLNDGFFDLDEYERFADQGENYGQEGYDGEEIDLFDPKIFEKNGDGSDDDEAFATYKDFFGDFVPQGFEDDYGTIPSIDGEGEDNFQDTDFDQDIFGSAEGEGFDQDVFNMINGGFGEGEGHDDSFDAMFGDDFVAKRPRGNFYNDDDDDTLMDLDQGLVGGQDDMANPRRQKNDQMLKEINNFMKIDDQEIVMDHLLSAYDERRKKLDDQIDALEREISGPKAWDMRGEASGYHRHKDDLINHDIDFEHGMKISAPITADVAKEFEQIIIARIRDNAFDDVQPRTANSGKDGNDIYAKLNEKDQNELSTAKPRFGLAEQYEHDFKQLAQGFAEENVDLQKKYQDISHAFAILSNQLDALCNYAYTAKVSVKELSITDSASVVNKTEIAPVATSLATINQGSLLTTTTSAAPQELHTSKHDGLAVSRGEMSKTEKDASIQRRKQQRKQHRQHEEDNIQQKAKAGDKGAQKKVDQDKFAKEYAKITKSGQVTVHATAHKGKRGTGPSHNYTTMAGVVDAVKHNEQQAALGVHKKKNQGGAPSKTQTHAKSIMQ